MRSIVVAAFAACLVVPSAAAAATLPRQLTPTGAWSLDYGTERCSLIREFTAGDGHLRLQIDSFGLQRGYRVMVSGNLVPGSAAAPIAEFRLTYSPDTAQRARQSVRTGKFGNDNAISWRLGFLPDGPNSLSPTEFERSVNHLTIAFTGRTPLQLKTGPMANAFAALHSCRDDLIASWGIDAAKHNALSRPVRIAAVPPGMQLVDLANGESHPGPAARRQRQVVEAMRRNGERVPVRVMIAPTGAPTDCVVQVDFASQDYREAICRQLTSYTFEPALDASGSPIASVAQFETR